MTIIRFQRHTVSCDLILRWRTKVHGQKVHEGPLNILFFITFSPGYFEIFSSGWFPLNVAIWFLPTKSHYTLWYSVFIGAVLLPVKRQTSVLIVHTSPWLLAGIHRCWLTLSRELKLFPQAYSVWRGTVSNKEEVYLWAREITFTHFWPAVPFSIMLLEVQRFV